MGVHIITVGLALLAGQVGASPQWSADVVVETWMNFGGLADGLESCSIGGKLKKGWSVCANPGIGSTDTQVMSEWTGFLSKRRPG